MKSAFTVRNVIIGLVVIALIGGATWGVGSYFQSRNEGDGVLTASGFVEAVKIQVSPELSGKVVSVLVQEGSQVRQGDEMMRIDDSLLNAQRAVAVAGLAQAEAAAGMTAAALDAAQTQYQAALDQALEQERAYRTANWMEGAPDGYDLPMWYFSAGERLEALKAELRDAQADLEEVKRDLEDVESQSTSSEFLNAEQDLARALEAYRVAGKVLEQTNAAADGKELKDEAQRQSDQARADLKEAQEAYTRALRTEGAQNVLEARARVEVAQERVDTILDQIRMLQTGELSPQVKAAGNILDQARAADDQAKAAVQGAIAGLALLDAQIAKAIVTAPADGVVLTRAVEPGSVVGAGAVVFTIAQMDRLTITVYVPEDRIGEVTIGMPVTIRVDSYPGAAFRATVTYLSDYAEFTPRNVQTVEGRRSTVYAVKLILIDGIGDLKPGMPADVTFED
ncbi:MAG: HlyD family efflux transporter periplasmic adaptor subunit [Anaerolineales bacterium]|nr:HlyD family efflux transporter periplasmic adaptor subunit [Anaerolineales bacterium]